MKQKIIILKKTLTPLHKLPQGHQTGRSEQVMRHKNDRRFKDQLRKALRYE